MIVPLTHDLAVHAIQHMEATERREWEAVLGPIDPEGWAARPYRRAPRNKPAAEAQNQVNNVYLKNKTIAKYAVDDTMDAAPQYDPDRRDAGAG